MRHLALLAICIGCTTPFAIAAVRVTDNTGTTLSSSNATVTLRGDGEYEVEILSFSGVPNAEFEVRGDANDVIHRLRVSDTGSSTYFVSVIPDDTGSGILALEDVSSSGASMVVNVIDINGDLGRVVATAVRNVVVRGDLGVGSAFGASDVTATGQDPDLLGQAIDRSL